MGRRITDIVPIPAAPYRPGRYRGVPTEDMPVRPPVG